MGKSVSSSSRSSSPEDMLAAALGSSFQSGNEARPSPPVKRPSPPRRSAGSGYIHGTCLLLLIQNDCWINSIAEEEGDETGSSTDTDSDWGGNWIWSTYISLISWICILCTFTLVYLFPSVLAVALWLVMIVNQVMAFCVTVDVDATVAWRLKPVETTYHRTEWKRVGKSMTHSDSSSSRYSWTQQWNSHLRGHSNRCALCRIRCGSRVAPEKTEKTLSTSSC